jgi:L-histidine Nalpha-methyltransferase
MQAQAFVSEFARDVHEGLTRAGQKTLPCRYFYDDLGSRLFEAISALPEYGLTRADARLVRQCAPEIARRMPDAAVVELGSGSGVKTRWVLEALAGRGRPRYLPIDVSATALDFCARELAGVADVEPLEGSYLEGLERAAAGRRAGERFLVLFLGSTIGNFHRDEAAGFLLEIRRRLLPCDALLLGADLEKPIPRMLAAYDDPTLVTAAFNLNLLARVNRELDGDFDLRNFVHTACYSPDERRVEMHLRARTAQHVSVRGAGLELDFVEGETIWTESSHKFRLADISRMARHAGLEVASQWTDREWPFAETLLVPAGF